MFSVIIPTYNRPKELLNCLKSLSKQSFLNFEVIIIDDHSETEVSKSFLSENYPFRIVISRNEVNCGAALSRNKGIKLCKYEWIAFLDDDDIWRSDKLEIINSAIEKNPDLDFIYHNSRIRMINEKTEYVTKREVPADFFKSMLVKNIIGGTSMIVIGKSLTEKLGFFDKDLNALEDYELWLRFSKIFKPKYIDQPLTIYNYETSVKSVSKNIESNVKALNLIRKKYATDYKKLTQKEIRENKEWEYSMLAHKCLLNYQRINAMKFYFRAFSVNKRIKFLFTSIISLIYPKLIFKLR
ncbi:TPA: hypothetical protein DCR49_03820 [Candidatus Delongbacteria bacterium]|nr:hypothetical protein [Candidatus Delongbacteria bacterium]